MVRATLKKDSNIHLHFICVFMQRCAQDKSFDWHRSFQPPPTMQSSPAPPVDGEVLLPVTEERKMTTSWPDEREKVMFKAFMLWHMIFKDTKKLRHMFSLWSLLANPLIEAVTSFTVCPGSKEDQLYQSWDKREFESKAKVLKLWREQTPSGGAGSSSK